MFCLLPTHLMASENAENVLDAVYARHRMVRIVPANPEDRTMAAKCEMSNAGVTLYEICSNTRDKKLRVSYAFTLLYIDWEHAHKPDALEDNPEPEQVKAEQVSAEIRVLADYSRSLEKPEELSESGNGGNISDRFIVSILDQFIEQVNSATKDDSRLVMAQRLRVLKALTGALDKMLDSENTGVRRNSHALWNLSLLRREWRKELGEAIQRYEQRTSSKEGDKELYVDAAKSLKREALPHLERLRKSVVVFRRSVNVAHKYESPEESVGETP